MIRRIMGIGLPVCVLIGVGVSLLAQKALLHAADGATKPASIDYQKAADTAGWGWLAEMADPLGCIAQCGNKYDIRMLSRKDDRYALTITIIAADKEVFTWEGHLHSVFRILGDRLYYAEFHPSGSGGKIVAVDLTTGKKLWTSPLKALGPIKHSAYENLMNLTAGDEVVTIWGNESMGRYVEFKSAATGETLGNKVLPKPTTSPKEALQGLQSLFRVQLKIPGATDAQRAEAVKQLREQLPQLNTAGTSDDWTLEFVVGAVVKEVEPPRMVFVGQTWTTCRCRISRPTVVNGRFATAVVYESVSQGSTTEIR